MDESEKRLIRNVQTHDLAESLRIRRATLAEEAGLPANQFALPFPPAIQILRETPPVPSAPQSGGDGLSWLTKTALVVAGLGLGGAGGAAATKLIATAVTPPSATTPVDSIAPSKEFIVRWWVDGAEVKTHVEPVPGKSDK